ncbi:hypothetical protein [Flavobacterium sp.]|uniref:hypothetical protein n=1 Tax=Flavobacterium sp. TaxID=239 RepID=UPI0037539591
MSDNKEYSKLSLEELIVKQKSLSNWQKIFIGLTVFSVASVLYAVYMKTKMHPFWILGSLCLMLINGSKLKKVEEEIKNRKK